MFYKKWQGYIGKPPVRNYQEDIQVPLTVLYGKHSDFGWLAVLRINVDLAIFQPYLDLESGDNQSLKIQVARQGVEPQSSWSASQELNHSATTAPENTVSGTYMQVPNETGSSDRRSKSPLCSVGMPYSLQMFNGKFS